MEEYWNFGADDMENIRGGTSFNLEALRSAEGFSVLLLWEEDNGAANTFSDWSENFSTRLNEAFSPKSGRKKEFDFGQWKGR